MKFLAIAATLFTTLAVAQNLEGQPACATSCLISAISAAGCAASDVACQCGPTQVSIAASAGPCLLDACPMSDLISAESAGLAKCKSFSATAGAAPTRQDNAGPVTGTGTATSTGTSTSSAGAAAVMTAAPVLVGAACVGVMGVLGAM
ncbi:uncharacterized protein PODANS_1_15070 [Podospora anserina S mat+]|uniref:Podospora anserina S mat+ genomic DNA chromosome 1, supercontig 4 n=1 Tax=Podospora anserina (strain S / ATCC MYA-4624 / DSM 980 / FGSC 10383) TaxID=515849 RepID=B2AT91_PODAN|nr:uncharacterized protein PODANS_1_15070 [Podospora anserina S mat+]CAP67614.1 unnamed protein product [Podospora anserina S mat+]CDP23875.1 Putative protein of unknown function [Podospora anserina S mat+]